MTVKPQFTFNRPRERHCDFCLDFCGIVVHPVPEVSPTDLLENKRNSFSRCNGNSSMIITHY